MKRLTTAAFTVLSVLACTPARSQPSADFSGIDARLKVCSAQHPDIPGSADCTKIAADAADKRLNEVYSTIVQGIKHPKPDEATVTPEILKRLITSERAWITFRDAECNFESTVALGAPLQGFEYVDCLYAQTKTRVKTLTAPEAPQNAR